ncbi:MAG: MarR family winged helix-turn-helix transcriptional regulator [Angelakisella sp.]
MGKNLNDNKLSIGNYISIFYRLGTSHLLQNYSEYNIGYGQYQFLLNLYIQDGLTKEQLTKRVVVDKATTSRSIQKLLDNGYVTVIVDEHDKRVHHIYLTQKAKDIQAEIMSIAQTWEDKLVNCLDDTDKQKLSEIFQKIAESNEWI